MENPTIHCGNSTILLLLPCLQLIFMPLLFLLRLHLLLIFIRNPVLSFYISSASFFIISSSSLFSISSSSQRSGSSLVGQSATKSEAGEPGIERGNGGEGDGMAVEEEEEEKEKKKKKNNNKEETEENIKEMGLDSRTATTADASVYFLQTSLWPAVVFTFILMITGALGNALVLFVYRFHFRRSVTRMFIFTLAALDLASCIFIFPAELLNLFRFASFPSAGYCKASRYLSYIFHGSSALILIAIAMDSCITISIAKKICVGGILLTAVVAFPSILIYGDVNFPILIKDGKAKILPLNLKNATWLPEGWYIENGTVRTSLAASSKLNASGEIGQHPVSNYSQVDSMDSFEAHQSHSSIYINHPNSARVSVLSGVFCLISSENSESPFAQLFYGYMCFLCLLLLVLVIYFYSRVARAMFLLRNVHTRMFSYKKNRDDDVDAAQSARNVTPGTGCLANELDQCDVQHPQNHKVREKPDVVEMVPDSAIAVSEENGVEKDCDLKMQQESERVEDSTNAIVRPNQDSSYISVISAGTDNQHASDCVGNSALNEDGKPSCDSVYESRSLETTSCQNLPRLDKEFLEVEAAKKGSPLSKSANELGRDNFQGQNLDNAKTISHKIRKLSSKRRSGKASKIKVSHMNEKTFDKEVMVETGEEKNFFLHPVATNNLLLQGTKSLENVDEVPAPRKGSLKMERRGSSMDTLDKSSVEEHVTLPPKSTCSQASIRRATIELVDVPEKPDHLENAGEKGKMPRPSIVDILSERHRRASIHPLRTSRILFFISLAFLVSFLPFHIIVLIRSGTGSSSFLASLDEVELGLVSLFIRSNLLSNAINPIIYGLLNTHFRRVCRSYVQSFRQIIIC
ncbi:neuropeptide s receptor [Plakobranchus ocellatus]|uniref:Neuropeptide s receptor n=1 Tax=Plakobranchus ocellatus TaxID=259542 RepID=A0AAV4DMU7_9GAST|nr:neuropeptide s receptor [Plakobranchus ocellatus]